MLLTKMVHEDKFHEQFLQQLHSGYVIRQAVGNLEKNAEKNKTPQRLEILSEKNHGFSVRYRRTRRQTMQKDN